MSAYELLMTRLDEKPLAVQVSTILEVINAVETTGFIDKPAGVIGLINLRGDIVPVHDLRYYTGVSSRELLASDQIVVIADGDAKVGVAVDRIETVQTFQEEQLFAQSLSPHAFKILTVKNREVAFQEIRTILET
ncbi:MAG: chemotaxis protein CheW [Candidatus Obscuribacterales bacterium]|nr:chemotaxis protein CheW [Candidatus Obscuribacterales bacterium]